MIAARNEKVVFAPSAFVAGKIGSCLRRLGLQRKKSGLIADSINFCSFEKSCLDNKTNTKPSCITVVGPLLGSPAMAVALETVLKRKVNSILLIGCCGCIIPEALNHTSVAKENLSKINEIIFPDKVICEDGTSIAYSLQGTQYNHSSVPKQETGLQKLPHPFSEYQESFNETVQSFLHCNSYKLNTSSATVITTDVPFLQNRQHIPFFHELGAKYIEMEASMLFTLCAAYNTPCAAGFVVSDIAGCPNSRRFSSTSFRQELKILVESSVSFLIAQA